MISISIGSKWIVYIILILIVLIVLWWVFGRKNSYEFIGLKPFLNKDPNQKKWWEDEQTDIESNYDLYEQESVTNTKKKTSSRRSFRSSNRFVKKPEPDSERSVRTPVVTKRNRESQGEFLSRKALVKIFKKSFPICRPRFLKSPKTGRNLELDGYNEELGIAFEYNGKQHYEYPNRFHKTEDEFREQLKRDQWKLQQCDENNIYLINIPYNIPFNQISDYIKQKLPRWSIRS